MVWGSLNGCPVLSIELNLVEVPDSETRTANISISITCESDCQMNWVLHEGDETVSEGGNAYNGTYYVYYTNTVDESKELGARVSIDGMWKDTVMTVYFPPIEDPGEDVANQTDSVNQGTNDDRSDTAGDQEAGFEMDTGSIAMIAMLLLFKVGVVAASMAARSKCKQKSAGGESAMAAFERDLFADTGPVASLPEMPEAPPPTVVENETIQPESEPVSDLPNIGDLLD